MTYVVPVEKSRYNRKLLLLNELRKFDINLKQKQKISVRIIYIYALDINRFL